VIARAAPVNDAGAPDVTATLRASASARSLSLSVSIRCTSAPTGGDSTVATGVMSGARAGRGTPSTRTPAATSALTNAAAAAAAGSVTRGCGWIEVKPVSRPSSTSSAETGATLPPLT
jgi:hypothetical protein